MQLKIQRSQRASGVVTKSVMFCINARAFYTPQEQANIQKYRLGNQLIYSSQAAQKHAAEASDRAVTARAFGSAATGSVGDSMSGAGSLLAHGAGLAAKSMFHSVAARLALNITIASLERGQQIECKDLDEVLDAESALYTACENLKGYLETAATFDGREVVIDFSKEEPETVSAPIALASPSTAPPAATISAAPLETPPAQDGASTLAPETNAAPAASPAYAYTPAQGNPWQPALDWWTSLTPEQRKWLMIAGGVVLLVILYKIF
jgi:cell division septation protein DedD